MPKRSGKTGGDQAALELSTVSSLSARRKAEGQASGDWRAFEHTEDEIAAALTLTAHSAARVLALALNRLPLTRAALAAGAIDERRASVIADELSGLDDAVGFLARLAAAEEIPLLLAVFLEAAVDEVTHAASRSSAATIQGPFYVPGAPLLDPPCKLPHRADEAGDVLVVSGTVRGTGGEPLPEAELDMWQATGDIPGQYSNVHPGIPDYNLRGRLRTDDRGRFEVETVVPAQYQIRNSGPTGQLFELIGRSAWRSAHLHFKVSHPAYRTLTTQLFFQGDQYLDTDAASAARARSRTASRRSKTAPRHSCLLPPRAWSTCSSRAASQSAIPLSRRRRYSTSSVSGRYPRSTDSISSGRHWSSPTARPRNRPRRRQ